ncbi:MAG: ABC transporter permease [Pseudomonadales bacterium]|jgi:putative ABC transport system permease protein|nr:ABC transporter permease [Pseudomonadales bacterium]MDP7594866.1 ABC transporter permease [Pseudomonadales bacterium]HJN51209.1 ABC transporter permease [Pseudomonadales bacterium]|tara:strand:- start:12345 stop:13541 length:1197 start_codon:yes stop_codon:yes gene_type:complete
MFNWVTQIVAITVMNLRSIPARWGSSSVIIVGIGGVVAVLVALLALANGFEATMANTGRDDRAVVMRGGATSELTSTIDVRLADYISAMDGISKRDGKALASAEFFGVVDVPKQGAEPGMTANLPMRGLTALGVSMRDQFQIIEGRMFEGGKRELVAGRAAATQFANLRVGDRIAFRDNDWAVVGIFSSEGDANESEVWADAPVVQSVFRGEGVYTSMRMQFDDPSSLDAYKQEIEDSPRLDLIVQPESEYYAAQSAGLTSLITQFGYSVAIIMAIGAIFGALNTMYTAVSSRNVEIATLRALGFSSGPVVMSVMVEALILALLGGLIGGLIAWAVFSGATVSTLNNSSFSQVSFDFQVSGELLIQGVVWACLIGVIGGIFPAIRAARLPISVALRGL